MAERLKAVDPVRLAAGFLSDPRNGARIAAAAARSRRQAVSASPAKKGGRATGRRCRAQRR